MTFNVCIEESSRGNVDLTISQEISNYPLEYTYDLQVKGKPMKIINLPEDYIGSMLQKYYELVKEGKQ